MSLTLNTYAEQIGSELSYGQTRRGPCPACGEKDYVVGREPGRVWWICFRASCGTKGIVGDARLQPAERLAALPSIMPYEGRALVAGPDDYRYFRERFDLDERTVTQNVRVTDGDEYLLPYRGPMGDIRGYVLRQPWWSGEPKPPRAGNVWDAKVPKTKLYRHTTEPTLAWYGQPVIKFDAIILVEDQISAMRTTLATGAVSVALMGNGINAAGVRDLASVKPSCVTIALDPNAQSAAQQIRMKWGGYFDKCRIVVLEQDPKDVPYKTLMEIL
jgi:hypothetical protein